ncbi:MAG: hypothetical protein Alpg2KO_25390 [Alphaproteobacteria bacterium]
MFTRSHSVLSAVALSLVLLPDQAQAGGVGIVAQTLMDQLGSIAALISALAFVLGLGLGASGLMKFRQHSDNPNAVPISQPLVRIVIGAMLIALPAVIGTMMGSFFDEDAPTTNLEGDIGELQPR